MKILFTGDLVIQDDISIDYEKDLSDLFSKQDYVITNFEGALLTESSSPILKAGPHVSNSLNAVNLMKDLHINIAGLSNNHIMDFGANSLAFTIDKLRSEKIIVLGACTDNSNIYSPITLNIGSEKIALLNASQAEFGVKKDSTVSKGYAWINSPLFKESLIKALETHNKVILYLHAGLEDQIIPLPEWKNVYNEFARLINGKGIIVACHPHIIQGYEIYNNTPIYYSLGNFCFPKNASNKEWNRGICVEYDTLKEVSSIIPIKLEGNTLYIDKSNEILDDFDLRSSYLNNNSTLITMANQISKQTWDLYYKSYYCNLYPVSEMESFSIKYILKYLLKRIISKIIKKQQIKKEYKFDETMLLHNIQIESHRFCVERYLYNLNSKENNFV